jgi:uncharacterized protein (TIGR02453 family)
MCADAFRGFPESVPNFLRDLDRNNNREWFNGRKAYYKNELLPLLQEFIEVTSAQLRKAQIPLRADPQRSVFRIYRDTRFSADKRPFKTNLGAVFDRASERATLGMLYFHLQPGQSFAALGFYQPEQKELTKIREEIVDRAEVFKRIVSDLEKVGLTLSLEGGLKRVPRGFEEFRESDVALFLKQKSFVVSRKLDDAAIVSAGLPERLVEFAKVGLPLLRFGWRALDLRV